MLHALPEADPNTASPFEDPTGETRVVRLAGMLHRLDHLAPFGEHERDAPMDGAIALAVTTPQRVGGISTEHRMEPEPTVRYVLHEPDEWCQRP